MQPILVPKPPSPKALLHPSLLVVVLGIVVVDAVEPVVHPRWCRLLSPVRKFPVVVVAAAVVVVVVVAAAAVVVVVVVAAAAVVVVCCCCCCCCSRAHLVVVGFLCLTFSYPDGVAVVAA